MTKLKMANTATICVISLLILTVVNAVIEYGIHGSPLVKVKQGLLQGSILNSTDGHKIFAFTGIPYAKPPVGQLRFNKPEPADTWQGVRNATKDGVQCPQLKWTRNLAYQGDENCLFLNVFTPAATMNNSENILMPVMVWIHGGGYIYGSSNSQYMGPHRLLNKPIILVSLNYRLGALGFLSTGDNSSVGNFAFYDQVLALQWVKENIAAFGGDRNRVTLFGESAGSFSVSLHIISPLSSGLFQNAIMQSGTAFCMRTVRQNPINDAKWLAETLNCSTNSTAQMISCLRTKSPIEIQMADKPLHVQFYGMSAMRNWWPTIEYHSLPNKFLPAHPLDLVRTGVLNTDNVIIGISRYEGALWFYGYPNISSKLQHFDSFVKKDLGQVMLSFLEPYMPAELQNLATEAVNFYNISKSTPVEESKIKLTELLGDAMFVNGSEWFGHELAKRNVNVRKYLFDYKGSFSLMDLFNVSLPSATHSDEIYFIFYPSALKLNYSIASKTVSGHFVDLWTNFATYRNPIHNTADIIWDPITAQNSSYLKIVPRVHQINGSFREEELSFWKNILIA